MTGRRSRAGLGLIGVGVAALVAAGPAGATTVNAAGPLLDVVAGDGEANDIVISYQAGPNTLTVTDSAGTHTDGPPCNELGDGVTVTCLANGVSGISADTGDLDDLLTIAPVGHELFPATLLGGSGADHLTADTTGDLLDGQAGNDTLDGGDGGDQLRGGSQDDTLNGGNGLDSLSGGTGVDTLNGDGDGDTMNGGFDADVFNGGSGSDVVTYADRAARVGIYSGNGPFSGNDDDGPFLSRDNVASDVEGLVGGRGNDQIWAQTNDDDLVSGGRGDDELMGIGGPTVFSGGPGTDTVTYFNRTNFAITASIGDGANDGNLGGAEGDDVQGDVENLVGGSLDDTLTGDNHVNEIDGMNGADTIAGLGGRDTAAYRLLSPGPGQLPVARSTGVTVDIGVGGPDDGSADDQNGSGDRDQIAADIEDLIGTPVSDTLVGSTAKNQLFGQGGVDTLRGGNNEDTLLGEDGDDTLDGGNDADVFNGGPDTDTATYAARKAAQPVTVTINALADDGGTVDDIDGAGPLTTRDHVQTTVENVRGGQGADSLTGSGGANELIGGLGADGLFGLGGDDVLRANDGIADTAINCGAGAADQSIEDPIDPAQSGCEL